MNPYENLSTKAFWKLSVSSKNMFDVEQLWDPKFKIQPNDRVVTFGSCFAQHISNALKNKGFNWLSTETPPHGLSEKNVKLFNYNIFSARTGNIYTTSLLNQWTKWATGKSKAPREVWNNDFRFYDPFRPRIEPDGFETEAEMKQSQSQAIMSFNECIIKADYFIFTLGLTESWINEEGYEYPICPGTIAGDFDPKKHKFKNQQFQEILYNLDNSIEIMRKINKKIKFILTVSPVPLTATMSHNHVLVATMESKSILRAVAGQLATNYSYVDYFPSYEIINSPIFKGIFFEQNQRSVNQYGVNFVMDCFFKNLDSKFGQYVSSGPELEKKGDADNVCEEELLEAFGNQ